MKTIVISAWVLALGLGTTPAPTVELKFGWRPGMSCRVEHRSEKTEAAASTVNFVLKTAPRQQGGLLVTTEFVFPAADKSAPKSSHEATQLMSTIMPAFHVDAEGKFAGLHDIEAVRNVVLKIIDRDFANSDAETRKRMTQMYGSQVMLEYPSRMFWQLAVESWRASRWEPGQKFETEVVTALPIGNASYTAKHVAEFKGETSCAKEWPGLCALMVSSQIPDRASLEKTTAAVMESFGTKSGDDRVDKIDVRVFTETLTHPDTLIPVRVSHEKQTRLELTEKGKAIKHAVTETRGWLFDCG